MAESHMLRERRKKIHVARTIVFGFPIALSWVVGRTGAAEVDAKKIMVLVFPHLMKINAWLRRACSRQITYIGWSRKAY